MITFLKELFCKHKYEQIAEYYTETNCNCIFYECIKCGKRHYSLSQGYLNEKYYDFKDFYKDRVKLWEKHQYELTEQDISKNYKARDFLESCLNK